MLADGGPLDRQHAEWPLRSPLHGGGAAGRRRSCDRLDRPLRDRLLLAWALLVAPYFLMMPGMAPGVAGARTPKPNVTRLKSLVGHSVFGLGMYATALAFAATQ